MNLNTLQWNTLRAAMDRIIPPDDFPGAWDAGSGDFLAGMFQKELRAVVPTYGDGLDALEAEAQTLHQRTFHEIGTAEQDAILQAVSEGRTHAHWNTPPIAFFRMLTHHVNEGYYSDPGNGGNRGGIAWKMTGFSERHTQNEAL